MIMMQTGPICVSDGEAQAHLPSPCPASRQVSVITIITNNHHHHHVDDNHSGNGDHHPHHPMLSSIFSLKSCFSFLANSPLVTREHLTSLRWLLHLSVVHTLQRTVAQLIRICGTHNLDCFFIVDILCSMGIFLRHLFPKIMLKKMFGSDRLTLAQLQAVLSWLSNSTKRSGRRNI